MKLIKISTDLELSVHEFPEGNHAEQNEALRELIGNNCRIFEHVMPRRLYTEWEIKDHPGTIPGQCVSMLIDEEGRLKENVPNSVGGYLYCYPIMGNILFVGEEWTNDGIDFCGIEEETFKRLGMQLNHIITVMRELKEVLAK